MDGRKACKNAELMLWHWHIYLQQKKKKIILVSCCYSCLLREEVFLWLSCLSRTNWTSFFTQDDLGFRHTFVPFARPALVLIKQTNQQINDSMMDTTLRCSWFISGLNLRPEWLKYWFFFQHFNGYHLKNSQILPGTSTFETNTKQIDSRRLGSENVLKDGALKWGFLLG